MRDDQGEAAVEVENRRRGTDLVIPDVYVPGARSVYDATIAEKSVCLPQAIDFRAFPGGNVTIVRPSMLVTPDAQGSYGLYFP